MLLYCSLICIVFLFLFFCWFCLSTKEGFSETDQPWYEKATEEFYLRFQRPLDPIHIKYFQQHCNHSNLQKNLDWIVKDLNQYEKEVKLGKQRSQTSSIVIAGLIRNGAFHLPALKEKCAQIVAGFQEYKIILVENNSTDGTRDFLLEWVNEDPNVFVLCQDIFTINEKECDLSALFPKSENLGGSPLPDRIQKMAFLRNVYLKHVLHYYSNYDYLCILDMDLKGDLYLDGFYHSIQLLERNSIDAVTCNGMLIQPGTDQYYYYDSFAHIERGDPILWENQTAKSNHDRYVHTYITHKYSTDMKPDSVKSAFGGAALYKIKSLNKCMYDFSSTLFSCEHSYFHKNLRVVVNPRFLFLISQNGI